MNELVIHVCRKVGENQMLIEEEVSDPKLVHLIEAFIDFIQENNITVKE